MRMREVHTYAASSDDESSLFESIEAFTEKFRSTDMSAPLQSTEL